MRMREGGGWRRGWLEAMLPRLKAWEHRTNGPKKKKPDFFLSLNG
jgi:hypothetical protein